MRLRRIVPYHGIGRDGPRYWVEIAEQPLSRYMISCLYEFYYWRIGWIARRLEPLNRRMHERTCALCRAARFDGGTEGFMEREGELYNVHYEPLFARQDERSFDLDHKNRLRIAWFETDEEVCERLGGGCAIARPPRRLLRRVKEHQGRRDQGCDT